MTKNTNPLGAKSILYNIGYRYIFEARLVSQYDSWRDLWLERVLTCDGNEMFHDKVTYVFPQDQKKKWKNSAE